MLLFLNLTLIAVVFCHCWNNVDPSSLLCEPPYTEPYVRWCGRTAEVTPPPTRSYEAWSTHRWSARIVGAHASCVRFAGILPASFSVCPATTRISKRYNSCAHNF